MPCVFLPFPCLLSIRPPSIQAWRLTFGSVWRFTLRLAATALDGHRRRWMTMKYGKTHVAMCIHPQSKRELFICAFCFDLTWFVWLPLLDVGMGRPRSVGHVLLHIVRTCLCSRTENRVHGAWCAQMIEKYGICMRKGQGYERRRGTVLCGPEQRGTPGAMMEELWSWPHKNQKDDGKILCKRNTNTRVQAALHVRFYTLTTIIGTIIVHSNCAVIVPGVPSLLTSPERSLHYHKRTGWWW